MTMITTTDLARIGARERLLQIQMEQRAILQYFPELRRMPETRSAPAPIKKPVEVSAAPVTRRRRHRLSPEARQRMAKAMSRRMKAYWREKKLQQLT